MDGKDAVPVVEAGNRVEPGMIEQVAAERGTSTVGHCAAGQDESDSAAASRELQRTFDEQLIPVDV
jgi:hypothetical protein